MAVDKKKELTLIFILIFSLLISLCACGRSSYYGTWYGKQNSVLILEKDGSCRYTNPNDGETYEGTWGIEDKKLYISIPDLLDGEIYADIGNDSASLLFEGGEGVNWNDELFTRVNS